MNNPLLSAGIWPFCVSVFSVLLSVFLYAKKSVFITQVREAKRIFRRGWERFEYASQMDEGRLFEAGHGSSRFLLQSRVLLYRDAYCLKMIGSSRKKTADYAN